MENPQTEPRPAGSMSLRIVFFIGGLIVLGIGVLITLGAALGGAIATGIAAYVLSRRKRRLTRRGAWFASVGGTVGVLAVLTGVGVLTSEGGQPATAAERAQRRAQAQQAMPDWLKTINPNAQRQSAQADSVVGQLLENKAVMVWAGLMVAVIASTLIGTIAGSFAWGGVMLMYKSFYGQWMPGTAVEGGLP
jgi:predicted PurR-regulated permease PerM